MESKAIRKKDTQTTEGVWGIVARAKGPLLTFLLALFFFILAEKAESPAAPGQLGPYFWPEIILILLMISCGIKGLEIFFFTSKESTGVGESPLPAVNYSRLIILIGLLIFVAAAMDVIGFLLANFFFLFLFMYAAGMRKKLLLFATTTVGTLGLLYLFVKVVYLPLPKGSWYFDDLTIFLYRILHVI